MKRLWLSLGILLTLFGLSLANIRCTTQASNQLVTLLNQAEEAEIEIVPSADCEGNDGSVLLEPGDDSWFRNPDGQRELQITLLWEKERTLDYLVVQEAIAFSQRVEQFEVSFMDEDGSWKLFAEGTTVGYKRIVPLNGLHTKGLRFKVTDARVAPVLAFVGVY